MSGPPLEYPWYATVVGDDLEQGDILESCPVFLPPDGLADGALATAEFKWEDRDVVIMSQSCDMVSGRERLDEVLLCAVWKRSELTTGSLAKDSGMEMARLGRMPGFHVLSECILEKHACEVRVVDFRRVYSLPISFIRKMVAGRARVRLLPPYREHLSQAFARYFMRVGLPVDIPSFTKK